MKVEHVTETAAAQLLALRGTTADIANEYVLQAPTPTAPAPTSSLPPSTH